MTDPTTWPTLAQSQPDPDTLCNWYFDNGKFTDRGTGRWQTVHHGIASVGDVNIPVHGGGFCSMTGLAVFDPKFLHWRKAQPLSPAAQAVIDAMSGVYAMNCPTAPALAASVIRAVADQVVPDGYVWANPESNADAMENYAQEIRAEILAIAAELESANA